MDVNDNLDEEEIAKLPVRLQYYEKERDSSDIVRQKLIEALFQVKIRIKSSQVQFQVKHIPVPKSLEDSYDDEDVDRR